jgi:hypothetical protein
MDCRKECVCGEIHGWQQSSLYGIHFPAFKMLYQSQRAVSAVSQDETLVTHLTPERKEKQPRCGNTDHLPQQPNSDVISKKDNSNCLMGPQISASCRYP